MNWLAARCQRSHRNAMAGVEIVVGEAREFPQPRDFAYCTAAPQITVRPTLHEQAKHRIRAVLAHEFAHAYLLQRSVAHTERQCDALANVMFGVVIRYDRDDVQTIATRGVAPRPSRLA